MSGWYAVKRGITSHPLFKKRPDRLAIWLWLLDNAAYAGTTHDVNGTTIKVARGSVCTSTRRIAADCGIGHQAVRTFLDRLQTDNMINTEVTQGRTLITICNWDKYQNSNTDGNTGGNTGLTQDQHTKETKKQITPKGDAASPPVDLDILNASVWQRVKPYLASKGVSDPGKMVGKWLKDFEPEDVLVAASKAQRAGTEDPIPYITKILNGGKPNDGMTEVGGRKGEWTPFGFVPEVG